MRPAIAGALSPRRPAAMPPSGATANNDTVQGIIRQPASEALACWTISKYCAMKMSVPIMLMNISRHTVLPARNWPDASKRLGTSAWGALRCEAKNESPAAAPIASAATTAGLDQLDELPRDRRQTTAVIAVVSSAAPRQSM